MRTAIWESMLNADMNAKYWKCLANRYSRRDKGFKIFLAIMASGTVAGWGLWEELPWLWKSLSSASAIIAIASPILNYQRSIEHMALLAGKWGELRIEYEDLWRQIRNHEEPQALERAYKKFRKIESTLQEKETKLPEDKALIRECFEEVKKTRGLSKGEIKK